MPDPENPQTEPTPQEKVAMGIQLGVHETHPADQIKNDYLPLGLYQFVFHDGRVVNADLDPKTGIAREMKVEIVTDPEGGKTRNETFENLPLDGLERFTLVERRTPNPDPKA